MNERATMARRGAFLLLIGLLAASGPAWSGNLVDEEKDLYVIRPLITEAPWVQTGAYLRSFLFDMPEAVSRPNAQVGFVLTPGFTWSVLNILELNVGFPLVLNPDETGDQELHDADINPSIKGENWDSHPDFDMPGLLVGIKGRLVGKKPEDRVFVALGVMTNIPIAEKWATNFTQWKTGPNETSPFVLSSYVTIAGTLGQFSPALQLGHNLRMSQLIDPATGLIERDSQGNKQTQTRNDFFFSLALPFAFPFEGTAPMLEFHGSYNFEDEIAQVFITPAVTFIPKGSPASLGFACMIPILDDDFRKKEGFRFLVNFSYRVDALAIPGADDEESEGSTSGDESPPTGW